MKNAVYNIDHKNLSDNSYKNTKSTVKEFYLLWCAKLSIIYLDYNAWMNKLMQIFVWGVKLTPFTSSSWLFVVGVIFVFLLSVAFYVLQCDSCAY